MTFNDLYDYNTLRPPRYSTSYGHTVFFLALLIIYPTHRNASLGLFLGDGEREAYSFEGRVQNRTYISESTMKAKDYWQGSRGAISPTPLAQPKSSEIRLSLLRFLPSTLKLNMSDQQGVHGFPSPLSSSPLHPSQP